MIELGRISMVTMGITGQDFDPNFTPKELV